MITKVNNTISTLKNLWVEMFLNKTNKVSNISDGSVLNAVAFGTAKVAQKAIKDIAIVEAQIFPMSATGEYLDKSAALFGVSPRKQALGSSTYVRVYAQPGTQYPIGTIFIAKNGVRFTVDQEYTVDKSGYGYVSVRSTITGVVSNVEANSITQVSPRPLTHIECTNEYAAVGGRDYEDDETFRNRILNYNNKLSEETVESWTQKFQDLNPNILRVMNVGLGEDGKIHIYLVTQNGSFFTDDELQTLLEQSAPFFGLTEINLSGESVGIVLENAKWMIVGGEAGVDFRVELQPDYDIATVRKNIQVALTKYLDFRFWDTGRTVQWDDLLQVVKNSEGVKYVPDEYFSPYYDQEVPLNMLPRIKGFRMRDLEGNILYDAGSTLSNIFYPTEEKNIYQGTQNTILAQKYLVSFTVTNTAGAAVANVYITIGNKIIVTDATGTANIQLENGEYEYSVSKAGWDEQTGEFVILNSPVCVNIENFTATPFNVNFTVLNGSEGLEGAIITVGTTKLETNNEGKASLKLEPNIYKYSITKEGFKPINSIFTVENQDLDIVERMFLASMNVNFSIIDRKRNVYVQQANLIISDYSLITDNEGQATATLEAGQYPVQVYKDGYERYESSVEITNEDPNCVLLEMTPIPYGVKFTVVDDLDQVIPLASIEIGGQIFLTDSSGIATAFLQNGTYSYRVYRVGYNEVRGTVTVSNNRVSEEVRLIEAEYALRYVIRDIETGNYIQGAEIEVANTALITNVNGVAQITVKHGTYDYTIKTQNYKEYKGTVNIVNQDVIETIYLELRDSYVTFTVTDKGNGLPAVGIAVSLINKGTQLVVSSGHTNQVGQITLQGEAAAYIWKVENKYYYPEQGEIVLEKLKDEKIDVVIERKPVQTTVKVQEYIPGFSGDEIGATSTDSTSSVEAVGTDGYNYIAVYNDNITVPLKGIEFNFSNFVKTYRKNQTTGDVEEFDFSTALNVNWKLTVAPNEAPKEEFVTVKDSSIVTVKDSSISSRVAFLNIVVTAQENSAENQIRLLQQKQNRFLDVKSGLEVTVTNKKDNSTQKLKTNAEGEITPTIITGIPYELKVTQAGFYQNDGVMEVEWDYEPQLVTMKLICTKTITVKMVQKNFNVPLKGAVFLVKNMSLDCTYTTPVDQRTGEVAVYVSPITLAYTASCQYHVAQDATLIPTASQTKLDLVLDYEPVTVTIRATCATPYNHAANVASGVLKIEWKDTSTNWTTTETNFITDADGSITITQASNGVKLPPTNNAGNNAQPYVYKVIFSGGNYVEQPDGELVYNIIPGSDNVLNRTLVRKTISLTGTVKEILPRISTTASNAVKAGLKLIDYYPNNSKAADLTTNANGQITRTVYAGLAERFVVNPEGFYSGNGVTLTLNYADGATQSKDLIYTNEKYVPITIKSDVYGTNLQGVTVKYEGLSVVQTQTTNDAGQVNMYLSPIPIKYTISLKYYNTLTGTFTPTGTENSISYTLIAKRYNVKITTNVKDNSNYKVNNVKLTFINQAKNTITFNGITDTNGTLTLTNVPAGTYNYSSGKGNGDTDEYLYYREVSGSVAVPIQDDETGNTAFNISFRLFTLSITFNVKENNLPYNGAVLTITNNSFKFSQEATLNQDEAVTIAGIRNSSFTTVLKNYANYYSNSTINFKLELVDKVIWNLTGTQDISFIFKESIDQTLLQGVNVSYNGQSGTTNNQGQITFKRSGVNRALTATFGDKYVSVERNVTPSEVSPITILMEKGECIVTLYAEEKFGVESGARTQAFREGQKINYTNTEGDSGTLTLTASGKVGFGVKINKEYTFTLPNDQASYYSESNWKHTFSKKEEQFNLIAVANKTFVVTVKDNVLKQIVPELPMAYASQYYTTNEQGQVTFYYSTQKNSLELQSTEDSDFSSRAEILVADSSVTSRDFKAFRKMINIRIVAKECPEGKTEIQAIPFANAQIAVQRRGIDLKLPTNNLGESELFDAYAGIEYTIVADITDKENYSVNSISKSIHYSDGASQQVTIYFVANKFQVYTVEDSDIANLWINGASITTWGGQTATTNDKGQFTTIIGGRTYPVTVTKNNYTTLNTNLPKPVANIKLAPVKSSITITLTAKYNRFNGVAYATSDVISGLGVALNYEETETGESKFEGTTNDLGQVTFGPMRAGAYDVLITGDSNWESDSTTYRILMPQATQSCSVLRKSFKLQNQNFRVKLNNQSESSRAKFNVPVNIKIDHTITALREDIRTLSLSKDSGEIRYIDASNTTINIGEGPVLGVIGGVDYTAESKAVTEEVQTFTITAYGTRTIVVKNEDSVVLQGAKVTVDYSPYLPDYAADQIFYLTDDSGTTKPILIDQGNLSLTYTVTKEGYKPFTWTDNSIELKTVILEVAGTIVKGRVVRIDDPSLPAQGCTVKFSTDNTSTAASVTVTNIEGNFSIALPKATYYWETGGTQTWGQEGTGDWRKTFRGTETFVVADTEVDLGTLYAYYGDDASEWIHKAVEARLLTPSNYYEGVIYDYLGTTAGGFWSENQYAQNDLGRFNLFTFDLKQKDNQNPITHSLSFRNISTSGLLENPVPEYIDITSWTLSDRYYSQGISVNFFRGIRGSDTDWIRKRMSVRYFAGDNTDPDVMSETRFSEGIISYVAQKTTKQSTLVYWTSFFAPVSYVTARKNYYRLGTKYIEPIVICKEGENPSSEQSIRFVGFYWNKSEYTCSVQDRLLTGENENFISTSGNSTSQLTLINGFAFTQTLRQLSTKDYFLALVANYPSSTESVNNVTSLYTLYLVKYLNPSVNDLYSSATLKPFSYLFVRNNSAYMTNQMGPNVWPIVKNFNVREDDVDNWLFFCPPSIVNSGTVDGKGLWSVYFPYGMIDKENVDWNGAFVVNPESASLITKDLQDKWVVNIVQNTSGSKIVVFWNTEGNTYSQAYSGLIGTRSMNIHITGFSCFWFNPITKAWQKSTSINSLFSSSYVSEYSVGTEDRRSQPTLVVGENSETELNTTTLTFLTQSNTDNNSYLFSLR